MPLDMTFCLMLFEHSSRGYFLGQSPQRPDRLCTFLDMLIMLILPLLPIYNVVSDSSAIGVPTRCGNTVNH
jgi:hypothetical protein